MHESFKTGPITPQEKKLLQKVLHTPHSWTFFVCDYRTCLTFLNEKLVNMLCLSLLPDLMRRRSLQSKRHFHIHKITTLKKLVTRQCDESSSNIRNINPFVSHEPCLYPLKTENHQVF